MNQSPQEAKDDFLALASHQLRTPATGVKQYLGMLKEGMAGPLSDLQIKLINKAYDSNERQLNIINELLFVARADSGQIKLNQDPISLNRLIEDIFEEQQLSFRNKNQICNIKLPRKDVMFSGDEQYMRMAIENIVTNASKYTGEGGKIEIALSEDGSKTIIEISDNGVGIDEEDRHLLFKKFSRLENELSAVVNGSGMGLYLAKKVVESHNGKIEFHSKKGVGSRVKFILPSNAK